MNEKLLAILESEELEAICKISELEEKYIEEAKDWLLKTNGHYEGLTTTLFHMEHLSEEDEQCLVNTIKHNHEEISDCSIDWANQMTKMITIKFAK